MGFVLPCDERGLPICDSFLAVSFECTEEYFQNNHPATYAFAYMAQLIQTNVPAFCLVLLGLTTNFQQR